MNEVQKKQMLNAVKTFLKACIPPLVALISSILTTLITGGETAVATMVGATVGTALAFVG